MVVMGEKIKLDSDILSQSKIDRYDDYISEFSYEPMEEIEVQTDMTDHLKFICSKCNMEMKVLKVETYSISGDDCTIIILACMKCKTHRKKKFCWNKD